ncbi:unnamed protein product [Urochloa humidicola]
MERRIGSDEGSRVAYAEVGERSTYTPEPSATYVQLPPADADALLAVARPNLVGHLVHLDCLRFARPVPRAVGIRTVPSSRSLPCVGNPEPHHAREMRFEDGGHTTDMDGRAAAAMGWKAEAIEGKG